MPYLTEVNFVNLINLNANDNWAVFVINGLIATPIIPLGLGPDMYVAEPRHFPDEERQAFTAALDISLSSFGFTSSHGALGIERKLLLVPITDGSDEAIKNALIVSDMALALLNRKYISGRARYQYWDRRSGRAIGATYSNKEWKPICKAPEQAGPAIVRAAPKDFWDWFLSHALRGTLSELGDTLLKSIEWSRESQFSPHITHRFAFMWVSIEAMLPKGEVHEGAIMRRASLIVGAPRGSDSKEIMNCPKKNKHFNSYKSPNSKKWVEAIQQMYQYRCAILHDGSSDLTSNDIDPKKVDWFYHLARSINSRLTLLAVYALGNKVTTVSQFWEEFVIDYLYSEKNIWANPSGVIDDHLISFDWEHSVYPDII